MQQIANLFQQNRRRLATTQATGPHRGARQSWPGAVLIALLGFVLVARMSLATALSASESTPAENLKYAASSSVDWRVDSLSNTLRLMRLCATNLRHAEQELVAASKVANKSGSNDFPLQKLLQGEGARIDLTQPYQAHLEAVKIEARSGSAGVAGAVGTAAVDAPPLIRAAQFHLRQKLPSAEAVGTRSMFLTLDASQADFGIVASVASEPTGAQRTMEQASAASGAAGASGAGGASGAAEVLSWPFVVDLQHAVDVRYGREPNGGPVEPAAVTGVMGELAGLQFTAEHMHALLAGDRRAGRGLFWAPAESGGVTGAGAGVGVVKEGAATPLAHLTATFAGGVTLTVEARSLVVELAWNAEMGGTEIRWAGAGQVHLTLTGLRPDAQPGSVARGSEAWDLRADAFSLISLPVHSGYEGVVGNGGEPAAALPGAEAEWPAELPRDSAPTFVLSVQGRGRITQKRVSTGPMDLPIAETALDAQFDQGLFELERPDADGRPASGHMQSPFGMSSEPVLQRAWLAGGGLVRPAAELFEQLGVDAAFYRDRRLTADGGRSAVGGIHATGTRLAAGGLGGGAGAGAGAGASGTVDAQRFYYQRDGGAFHAVAVGGAEPVRWQDGAHLLEAPVIELSGDTMTCSGAKRFVEDGGAP